MTSQQHQFIRDNIITIIALAIVSILIPISLYASHEGCGGSLVCSGDGGSGGSTEGQACYTASNACGVYYTGVICGGVCSNRVQTGTDSKGNAQYTCYPLSTPANPVNLGHACQSGANACGQRNTGAIQCNGQCSASTPANPANLGTACQSAANACGQRNTGTIGCNGQCSASTPANPAGYGTTCQSPANACGQRNTGTIQCNGQCSVSTTQAPALPDGYGNSCQSAANSCGMRNTGVVQCSGQCSASVPSENLCEIDATVEISAVPNLVQKEGHTTITWSSTDATSCTVVGTNGDSWSGTSGNRTTGAIADTTTYSISCVGVNTKVVTDSVIVRIVPVFQEL